MPRPNRRHKGTDLQTYTWEGVPRALIAAAIAKGKTLTPKVSLRTQLQTLLETWVGQPEKAPNQD